MKASRGQFGNFSFGDDSGAAATQAGAEGSGAAFGDAAGEDDDDLYS